jgi:hypothetical protein
MAFDIRPRRRSLCSRSGLVINLNLAFRPTTLSLISILASTAPPTKQERYRQGDEYYPRSSSEYSGDQTSPHCY